MSTSLSGCAGAGVALVCLALALWPPTVRGEVFTALVHMEGLVALEKELLGGLEAYLQLERERCRGWGGGYG